MKNVHQKWLSGTMYLTIIALLRAGVNFQLPEFGKSDSK